MQFFKRLTPLEVRLKYLELELTTERTASESAEKRLVEALRVPRIYCGCMRAACPRCRADARWDQVLANPDNARLLAQKAEAVRDALRLPDLLRHGLPAKWRGCDPLLQLQSRRNGRRGLAILVEVLMDTHDGASAPQTEKSLSPIDVGPCCMLWDAHRCPRCGLNVGLGIMSLRATCPCGLFYAAVTDGRGWYESMQDYREGRQWRAVA